MKIIQFNKDNITKEKIEKTVRKSRGIVLNEEGKALVVNYAGLYMLPGGKIEEGEEEKVTETLKREVLEEAGIEKVEFEEEPFLKIESYDKDYYDRQLKKNISRLTETFFYFGKTKEQINLDKQSLTESEKNGNFSISFENLSVIQYLVENNKTDNEKKENFDREILTLLKEFANYRKEKDQDLRR